MRLAGRFLGGYRDAFVASGSEDNRVYLWHRQSQTLLETLEVFLTWA